MRQEIEFFRKKVTSHIQNLLGIPDRSDLGRMANLRLIDKQGKELVELKLQVLA